MFIVFFNILITEEFLGNWNKSTDYTKGGKVFCSKRMSSNTLHCICESKNKSFHQGNLSPRCGSFGGCQSIYKINMQQVNFLDLMAFIW